MTGLAERYCGGGLLEGLWSLWSDDAGGLGWLAGGAGGGAERAAAAWLAAPWIAADCAAA
jgi:hypothetical protein